MRRVVLLALGSRGDVLPLVRLACALRREGHEATVVTSDDYEGEVRAAEVPFVSIAPGMHFAASSEVSDESRRARFETPIGTMIALRSIMRSLADPLAGVMDELVGSDDVLVTGVLGTSLAAALRQVRGCGVVHVTFAATVPTACGGSYICAPLPTRVSTVNRSASAVMQRAFLGLTMAPGREYARRHGRALTVAHVDRELTSGPTLIGTSPLLAPPAGDWPGRVTVTGPWMRAALEPPPTVDHGLEDFLAAGTPPVYIGFGSAVSRDPIGDLTLFAAAARDAGVRVVARRSDWSVGDVSVLGPHAYVVDTVPHDALLPRTAAVIHHGGAGTTVAALAAGVPSSVIWHNLDQPFHARRTSELGVGPLAFSKRRLTRSRLARLIESLVSSSEAADYRRTAKEIGVAVRQESGLANAITALRQWRAI